jgi:hypothetical protein
MSKANVTWRAPRIRNELTKIGIEVSHSTVARYMARHPKPPSPTWRAFLDNHVKELVSIDFFVVPTATTRAFVWDAAASHRQRPRLNSHQHRARVAM